MTRCTRRVESYRAGVRLAGWSHPGFPLGDGADMVVMRRPHLPRTAASPNFAA